MPQTINNSTITSGVPSYILTGNGAGGSLTGAGAPNVTISASTWTNTAAAFQPGGVMELNGDKADILINGSSLMQTLEAIQSSLNVLIPNPALEAEWDELKELGNLYRKKEAEFKEKKRMWEILNKDNG